MSFLNQLDISEETEEFQRTIRNQEFKCIAANKLLSLGAGLSLNFCARTPQGNYTSIIKIDWKHRIPQPFGFHVIPSGDWKVTEVQLSGALVRKACRLDTAARVLESHKETFAKAGKVADLEEEITLLKTQITELTTQFQQAQASAIKAKEKLHKLRDQLQQVTEKGKNVSFDSQPNSPADPQPSSSSKPVTKNNNDLFQSWAGDGTID
ncbi:ORF1 [Fleabane torradovirus]|uniref:ORF1 n=1 Tax=Fleabane torradovirus TaxID=2963535 RepID=A0AAE9SJX6_9SECO|nr:ORF1 [Fleabane torradovirus]